jgi:Ca-activated chloride channel family protein
MREGNNRIILATDGDFNVGQNSEKDLEELVSKERKSGVFLTCLGVGMGNYKDSKIEVLAKRGNGNFAYIDDIREAEKVLVTEFTQTVYSVASDVIISAKFDTSSVLEYRLIGYDNKKNILDEKTNELEGGEIGSGSGNTIVFEIVPASDFNANIEKKNIAAITVNYRIPESNTRQIKTYQCPNNYLSFNQLGKTLQFATSVVMYGLKLRESKYFPEVNWDTIRNLADSAATPDNYLQAQFVELVDKSKIIYTDKKKRRKNRK